MPGGLDRPRPGASRLPWTAERGRSWPRILGSILFGPSRTTYAARGRRNGSPQPGCNENSEPPAANQRQRVHRNPALPALGYRQTSTPGIPLSVTRSESSWAPVGTSTTGPSPERAPNPPNWLNDKLGAHRRRLTGRISRRTASRAECGHLPLVQPRANVLWSEV